MCSRDLHRQIIWHVSVFIYVWSDERRSIENKAFLVECLFKFYIVLKVCYRNKFVASIRGRVFARIKMNFIGILAVHNNDGGEVNGLFLLYTRNLRSPF